MLLTLFLTCFVSLVLMTGLLLAFGHRISVSSRVLAIVLTVVMALVAGEVAAAAFRLPAAYVERGELILAGLGLVVALARPRWNPIGQVFFSSFLASALTYLVFAGYITVATGLSPIGMAASALLFVFEFFALFLSATFTFESCDVICRTRWDRDLPDPDRAHRPMVSLHIAAYNEPPDMLIETIKSVEGLDYPDFEVVVIDNNTQDPEVWRPVEDYCRDRPRVKFVHVENLEGYKAGALNLVLREHIDPKAEIIGVVDSDYLLDRGFLNALVGYFADPAVAFVQSPQDYREYEGDAYLTACYDAYKYFFATSMPSRNERDSIIFAGTMGLLRRSTLEELGGWDPWFITEDAETSLRMLKAGHSAVYVAKSFGKGIMPLTFASLKSQRFRWCFGGMQILRRHRRDVMPWNRDPANHLSFAQRFDYLVSGLQWLNDLVYLGFTVVLLATALLLATKGRIALRPLFGAAVLLPSALIASGLLRALWALREQTGIGVRRALLAFANWLSLSWTVALACVQGLVRSEGVFLRTPKAADRRGVLAALWAARSETVLAGALWGGAVLVGLRGTATPFVLALFAWQGAVYASSPFMSWLNQHTELSAQLERRRRSERMRERVAAHWPYYAGAAAAVVAAVVAGALFVGGGLNPGARPKNPFVLPHRSPGDAGPLGNLVGHGTPSPAPTTPVPSSTPSSSSSPPSPSPSSSPSASTSP